MFDTFCLSFGLYHFQVDQMNDQFHQRMPTSAVARYVSLYLQSYTQFGAYRPFGVASIIGGYDEKPELWATDPSATLYVRSLLKYLSIKLLYSLFLHQGYRGVAFGKEKTQAQTDIEMLPLDTITCRDAVFAAARMYALRTYSS